MVRALRLPWGSRGLDAGCGIGLQCQLLAEEVGPDGHVTGVDIAGEMLDYGRRLADEKGLMARISFQEGDINRLPFPDGDFDWVWSVDCAGYAPLEPLSLLQELARVVRPGGTVAIAAWSSEKLLPGYPRLEARLGATAAGIAPFTPDKPPERHFLRALGWFQQLWMKDPRAESFAGSVSAPLDRETRGAMTDLFEMRWPGADAELTAEDKAEFRRLCRPDSPDFILNLPDYQALFTYTMFWGKTTG
jgi:demethylmenaquinone methyltransferase/2-methoxy-6-polyprenyl-1,4-benzoquinol methylase